MKRWRRKIYLSGYGLKRTMESFLVTISSLTIKTMSLINSKNKRKLKVYLYLRKINTERKINYNKLQNKEYKYTGLLSSVFTNGPRDRVQSQVANFNLYMFVYICIFIYIYTSIISLNIIDIFMPRLFMPKNRSTEHSLRKQKY